MPLFRCSKCGCVDNTAVTNYWTRTIVAINKNEEEEPPLCSECDPKIGIWHDFFEKKSAVGYLITDQGFLYTKQDKALGTISSNITIVGEVTE